MLEWNGCHSSVYQSIYLFVYTWNKEIHKSSFNVKTGAWVKQNGILIQMQPCERSNISVSHSDVTSHIDYIVNMYSFSVYSKDSPKKFSNEHQICMYCFAYFMKQQFGRAWYLTFNVIIIDEISFLFSISQYKQKLSCKHPHLSTLHDTCKLAINVPVQTIPVQTKKSNTSYCEFNSRQS